MADFLKHIWRAAAAGLLTAAIFSFAHSSTAFAEDPEEEDSIEQKVLNNVLSGLGVDTGRAKIEYRERSPLVLPATPDLPPPETAAVNSPAWPKDADIKEKKRTSNKPRVKSISELEDPGRPLRPDEVAKGATAARTARAGELGPLTDRDIGRPLKPSELGYQGGIFSTLFNSKKEEEAKFTGEPDRTSLTQPPPGYQTPSPAQPYGINSSKKNTSTLSTPQVKDRNVGE